MNRVRKFMVSALALIAGAVLVLTMAPAHAYAAETRGSSVYKTYDGVNYEAYNTLSTAALAMATPRIVASKTLPAGSLGLDAMLVENGSIIDYVTRYTGVSGSSLRATASAEFVSGRQYRAWGRARVYDGSAMGEYRIFDIPQSPILASRTIEMSRYGVTNGGKTYGSITLSDQLGFEPDLIQAVAENGATGYVRREDLWIPEPDNPQEAVVEYGVERTRSIPVYNLAGSVVGWFSLRYGGTD